MINLNEVLDMWAVDGVIDDKNLDSASRDSAVLHSKYLDLYNQSRINLKSNEHKMKIMLKEKWLYYGGKMTKSDLDERKWDYDAFDGMTSPLKSDMHYYYNSDKDLQALEMKIEALGIIRDTLKEIMDNIKWRHVNIKNMISWKMFQAGA